MNLKQGSIRHEKIIQIPICSLACEKSVGKEYIERGRGETKGRSEGKEYRRKRREGRERKLDKRKRHHFAIEHEMKWKGDAYLTSQFRVKLRTRVRDTWPSTKPALSLSKAPIGATS